MSVCLQGINWYPAQTVCYGYLVSTACAAEVPLLIFIFKTGYPKIFRGFPPARQDNAWVDTIQAAVAICQLILQSCRLDVS
jgi:hypothetical protein